MLPSDIRSIHQAYSSIYEEIDLVTDELVEEIVEELIQECLEFGYEIDEAADVVEEAAIEYLMELNPYAPAGSKEAKAYQKSTTATKRGEERKAAVSAAKEKVKAKVKGAVAGAGIAASIAKDEARRAGRKATHAVSSAVQKKKAEVKSGVKSMIGRGLRKAAGAVGKVAQKAAGAASRLGEEVEQLDEISQKTATNAYAASKTGEFEGADSERDVKRTDNLKKHIVRKFGKKAGEHADKAAEVQTFGRKDASGRRKQSPQPRIQTSDHRITQDGKMHKQDQRELKTDLRIKRDRRLRKEEVEQVDTWDVVLEYLITNGHADTNAEALYVMSQLDEEMIQSILEGSYEDRIAANNKKYDAARKRAAQRAAARNAARDAGQTGAVPGVGYVTPRRERTSYTDSSGTQRHHSGAKMP